MRAERLKDMLSVKPKRLANRLLRTLGLLFVAIDNTTLPDTARWLLRTRWVWIIKKNGKPRPVKMGEMLRCAYAKRKLRPP